MARTRVFMNVPGSGHRYWKTDLKGHGAVGVGEEFIASAMWQFGKCHVIKDGPRFRVRVKEVGPPPLQLIEVDILEDLTKPIQKSMF